MSPWWKTGRELHLEVASLGTQARAISILMVRKSYDTGTLMHTHALNRGPACARSSLDGLEAVSEDDMLIRIRCGALFSCPYNMPWVRSPKVCELLSTQSPTTCLAVYLGILSGSV